MDTRITQKTIAKEAGVSVMTVSLAMRDDPRVAAKTRERVRALATRLGYRPDPLLNALNHYRDRCKVRIKSTIALVSTRFEQRYWREAGSAREMMKGMRERCDELGYTLDLLVVDRRSTRDARIENIIRNRGIRGLVIGPVALEKRCLELKWNDLSAVAIGGSLDAVPIPTVLPDYWGDTILALDNTHRLTSGRIGMILSEEADQHSRGQWSGAFLHWQTRQKMDPISPCFIHEAINAKQLIREIRKKSLQAVLFRHHALPQALAGLPQSLRESVAWVALNRNEEREVGFPGIEQGRERMGRLLIEIVHRGLLDVEASSNFNGVRHFVPGQWVP